VVVICCYYVVVVVACLARLEGRLCSMVSVVCTYSHTGRVTEASSPVSQNGGPPVGVWVGRSQGPRSRGMNVTE